MTEPAEKLMVEKQVRIGVSPKRACELFTHSIGSWWPLHTHSVSSSKCAAPSRHCAFETREGGALYEIMADGRREDWGRVKVWAPPQHLQFTWHPGLPPGQATLVDVTFEKDDAGGTLLTLRHTGWEARGEKASEARDQYDAGWEPVLTAGYAAFVKAAGEA